MSHAVEVVQPAENTGSPKPVLLARGESALSELSSRKVLSSTKKTPAADQAVVEHDTDVAYDQLTFTKKGVQEVYWKGMPSCQGGPLSCMSKCCAFLKLATSMEKREVVIRDARLRELDYETTGFTLCPLKSAVTNWQAVTVPASEQQRLFSDELEQVIRKLHPDVTRVVFQAFLLRGGGDNPPAANGLHLDMYPDMDRLQDFVRAGKVQESPADDLGGLELKMVLGLWMPREMTNPVHDFPFFFADASTFDAADVVAQKQDFYQLAGGEQQRVRNLAASPPIFSPRQRWYYYSKQTTEELVIFRHLTNPAGGKACFHASFQQPLPEGMDSRKSVETRAFLYAPPGTHI